MYYQKEWSSGTQTNLGLLFQRIIYLPLNARQNALIPNLYAYTFVHTRAILPYRIFGPCLSVRVSLSPDRGLPLSTNSVLHIRPQISTKRPPLCIVGLICNLILFYIYQRTTVFGLSNCLFINYIMWQLVTLFTSAPQWKLLVHFGFHKQAIYPMHY